VAISGSGRLAPDFEPHVAAEAAAGGNRPFLPCAGHVGPSAAGLPVPRRFDRSDPIDANRLGDVLELSISQVVEPLVGSPRDLFVDTAGNAYAAGLGDLLQARGQVDAVPVDVRALDDDVPEVHADTQPDAALVGQVRLALGHGVLYVGGALDRPDDARKLGQEAVAHELHDAPLAGRDLRLHQRRAE
jgi:hypothetical protein